MEKALLIRFSSIGDIVLTTPVIRCLKKQRPDIELHFLTKKSFANLLQSNPYIDRLHTLDNELKPIIEALKAENFHYVIDLHNNQRTWLIKKALKTRTFSFNKINLEKWLMVNLKWNRLPKSHIVDRYLETVADLGVKNDGEGLDYFIPAKEEVNIEAHFPEVKTGTYIAAVIGAKHATKQMPKHKWMNLCELIEKPVIVLGGPEDAEIGEEIASKSGNHVFNACGKFTLHQSASIVRQAEKVISHDTGLMHIAAAFNQNIASIWGNTIPELGMYPYLSESSNQAYKIFEMKDLNCRPCSKIGYPKCPKKHFACMELIDETLIADWANETVY
ncbi:MAG: glycosyltransferase family 9 protein [Chitinophagales bacterium]